MSTEKKMVDAYIRNRLNHSEVEPPEMIWENISNQLNRKNRKFLITVWSSIAAGMALIIGIYIFQGELNKNQDIAHNNMPASKMIQHKSTSLASVGSKLNLKDNLHFQNQPTFKSNSIHSEKATFHAYTYVNDSKQAKVENAQSVSVGSMINSNPIERGVKELDQAIYLSPKLVLLPSQFRTRSLGEIILNNFQPVFSIAMMPAPVFGPLAYSKPLKNKSTQPILKVLPKSDQNSMPVFVYDLDPDQSPPILNHNKVWDLQCQGSPLFASHNISSSDNQQNTVSGNNSYGAVVKIGYYLADRLSLQAGLSYDLLGYTINSVISTTENSTEPIVYNPFGSRLPTAKGTYNATTGLYVTTISTNAQMQFLEMPFDISYNIIDSKVSVCLSAGISPAMEVGGSSSNDSQSGSTGNNASSFTFAGITGIGVIYKVNHSMKVLMEPSLKYFLSPVNSDGTQDQPYAFGVFTGIIFQF